MEPSFIELMIIKLIVAT